MTTFVALYRGQTIAEVKLIAVSADLELVSDVTSRILQGQMPDAVDPVIKRLESGRRDALSEIRREITQSRRKKKT
jgi:hypothetical protein